VPSLVFTSATFTDIRPILRRGALYHRQGVQTALRGFVFPLNINSFFKTKPVVPGACAVGRAGCVDLVIIGWLSLFHSFVIPCTFTVSGF